MANNHRLSTVCSHTSSWSAREAEIARIAAAQHQQVTLTQLVRAGVSDGGIRHRLRAGRLHRIHPGVYSIGRPSTGPLERGMAAVLACGPRAALSHASAAAQLGIRQSAATAIDVTSPSGRGRGLEGIRAHRSALPPEEITVIDGIPTTTCARTLLDLAETLHLEALARALDRAEILRLFDLTDLKATLARNPGRHGLAPLQALLSSLDPATKRTRNDFEWRLYALCDQASLPRPIPNPWLRLGGSWIQPDFLWREARLIAETDGYETHSTRQAFERDRARDQLLLRAGYRTVRFTWRQLRDEPAVVAATIRAGVRSPGGG